MQLLFLPSSASLNMYQKTDISLDKIFQIQRFKCRWNNAVLAANGCPRGHNYSIWRRLVSPQPWQVKSNVIVQWKAVPCFVLAVLTTSRFCIQFSCWEEHRFARTKASPVNISHWLASQMYLRSPSLFSPLSPIFLPLCQSFILCTPILFQPPLPQTLPHLSIHPSIHPSSVFNHLSLIAGILLVLFLSLSLCVFLYLPPLLLTLPSCEDSAEMSWGTQFQTQEPETYGTFSTPKVNYSYLSRDCS